MYLVAKDVDNIPGTNLDFFIAQQDRCPPVQDEYTVVVRMLIQARTPAGLHTKVTNPKVGRSLSGSDQYSSRDPPDVSRLIVFLRSTHPTEVAFLALILVNDAHLLPPKPGLSMVTR
jgi:hypothetical protein